MTQVHPSGNYKPCFSLQEVCVHLQAPSQPTSNITSVFMLDPT